MAVNPDDPFASDLEDEAPAARPAPTPVVVVRPAAPAAPTPAAPRRAPSAPVLPPPPDPSATGAFPFPPRVPAPAPAARPAPAPVPAASSPVGRAVPAPAPVSRPVPPFVPPAAPVAPATAEAEFEDDEAPQKKGGIGLGKVLTGFTVSALVCAGLAYNADDIRDTLRGDEVVQPTVVPAPTIPAPVTPKNPVATVTPVAPVAPTVAPASSTWTKRSNSITNVYTPAIGEELSSSGAKASMTIECNDGAPVSLFYHNLPAEKPVAVDASKDTAETMYTNYGTLTNPWVVCEDAKKGSSQWTSYLK